MTKQQRTTNYNALLEWMGWTKIGSPPDEYKNWMKLVGVNPKHNHMVTVPELTLDLLHQAAMRLKEKDTEAYWRYGANLLRYCTTADAIDATTDQRLEALCKALGIWKE